MSGIPAIKDTELVTSVYGYFPGFHDSEVTEIICRRGEYGSGLATITFTIHGWEMTSEVKPDGFNKLIKNNLITFQFVGVDSVDLHHWNHQNVLFELIIKSIDKPLDHALVEVELSSSFGLEGSFRAVSGRVLSVVPCNDNGLPLG